MLLGPVGLRQDHDLAHGRGLRRAERRHGAASAAPTSPMLPPWQRNTGMVFQSYALFPHMTRGARTSPSAWRCASCRAPRSSARVEEALRAGAARRLWRPPAAPALGRPAAARRARPRARDPARRAAARRAALQPRRQAARGGAGRDPRAAAPARPHHRHGDARPGGGAHHGRPAGGHGRGRGPPGRQPARPLRAAGRPLRRGLRRPQHLPRRHASTRRARSQTAGGLRLSCRDGAPGRGRAGAAARAARIARRAPAGLDNRLPGTVEFVSYLGAVLESMCACRRPTGWWCRSPNRGGGFAPGGRRARRGRLAARSPAWSFNEQSN